MAHTWFLLCISTGFIAGGSQATKEVCAAGEALNCDKKLPAQSASMLQTMSARSPSHLALMAEGDWDALKTLDTSRSAAKDAQFLMRATFGPSRTSMAELKNTTYEDWIKVQMDLPFELHRVYYRKRTNPQFEDYMVLFDRRGGGVSARPRCAKGSRWEEVAESRVSSYTETDLAFVELKPTVLLLNQSQGQSCSLEQHDFIKTRGKYYQHSPRVELFDNTPYKPMAGILETACPVNIDERRCRLLPPGQKCFAFCGSDGEVANDPGLGHHFGFRARHHDKHPLDVQYDSEHRYRADQAKTVVWVMKALRAADQLRQRVAWALAQIFVAAPEKKWSPNERWLHFYDIFVRNAFGNFRDVLANVTYNPVMNKYLTYHKSWSYDYDRFFADENYAREIMQLFSIGLEMLRPDGSPQLDSQNRTVPTYGNEEIMTCARVFTGFQDAPARSNGEGDLSGKDRIAMRYERHDIYPKPDLRGGWLGDGYPLCGDLPPRAYLSAGAVYEFRGYKSSNAMPRDIYEVPKQSALFSALCRQSKGLCAFALRVELAKTSACFGGECKMDTLRTVRVSSGGATGFYEYVPPTCVYHFFYNGVRIAGGSWAGKAQAPAHAQGVCANPDWPVAGASCCTGSGTCTNRPGSRCGNPRRLWCGRGSWKKKKLCALACFQIGQGYPGDNCSNGLYREQRICGHPQTAGVRLAEARALCRAQGLEVCGTATANTKECPFSAYGRYVWTPQACASTLQVHWDGKVSGHTESHEHNRFAVKWEKGAPAEGEYNLTVEAAAVFTSAPSKEHFLRELPGLIGAYPPAACPSPACGGDGAVCFCGPPGRSAVLRFEGRFYKNLRSVVNVAGHKFRNPPVFRVHKIFKHQWQAEVTDAGAGGMRMSIAEVDAHLDQLFNHQNTAPFMAKLLIQRLVKSNPTPAYVEAVAEAFKSGAFAGKAYGGKYGDLGATVAAILLHPEALEQTGGPNEGAFREPLLKVLHFMRAMEYQSKDDYVAFGPLMSYIAEAPFGMPTVFNFYDPEFTPDRFDEGVYAPEFQIFDGPTSVGLLNGLISLIEHGLMDEKTKGNKTVRPGFGQSYRQAQGALAFQASKPQAVDATVDELDLLLTGKRLAENTKQAVRQAYNSATAGEKLKAAQAVIAMSPEFHTYGPVLPQGPVTRTAPVHRHAPRDYKAMVMILLTGGADSWSFAVPLECELYEEYKQVRQGIALTQPGDFYKVNTPGQSCEHFGIHAAMPTVAGLYRDGDAAIVSNIGSLVEPLTRETYANGGKTCTGLFSHKHMQAGVMTSMCQFPGGSPKGVGGRMADALSSGSQRWSTQSFSIKGNNIFSKGVKTNVQVIDSKKGSVRFHYAGKLEDVLRNITGQRNGNIFCEEYAQSVIEQIHAASELGDFLDTTGVVTDFELGSDLSEQLHQVARLIRTRHDRKAERDFFFVRLGHWDMHQGLMVKLPEKLGILDGAIKEFVEELKEIKVFDSVTMVTHSDFGRTLTTNGDGADHAWAGQQIVIGGSINGERVYNDFPSTLLEHAHNHTNEYDIGRGRLIPKYPWESVMVPIAQWMGVNASQMDTVFPNLANFNGSHIISGARGAGLFPGQ